VALTIDALRFLTSSEGQHLLQSLMKQDLSEPRTLLILTKLRKEYAAEAAAAALTMARLQQKATSKFGDDAFRLLFIGDALEQASHPLVRAYRARQVRGKTLLDVCCGIGADSLTFAEAGIVTLGVDIDPVRIAVARHNATMLGIENALFEVQDVTQGIPDGYEIIFFDPARRDETGRRIFDVEAYQPPLSLIQSWQGDQIMVKLSPGVKREQLTSYPGKVEFISVQGELKEAVLHYGDVPSSPHATLLTLDGAIYHWHETMLPDVPVRAPLGWLVEPDPALIRAGLVQAVATQWNGSLLDETIAYFTTPHQLESPWVRSWEILDWMPFQLKRLRAYLREHHVGHITVKKRGFAMQPEELIARLKLKNTRTESRTVVMTRHQGQPIAIICADRT